MDKLKMHSPNLTDENVAKIRDMFPGCVTEAADETGKLRWVVDFDQLRQELSDHVVEGGQERYRIDWPGKREALLAANAPIAKTLRPVRDESVSFDTTKNLFIEGDNLDALKLLQETYLGQIKMVYIDPPYNTNNDFIYDDDFAESNFAYLMRSNQSDEEGGRLVSNPESNGRFHSDWLSMIYPRLKLARNLLSESGIIAVHIDEHEHANLEKLLSDIFGEKNNIGTIVWDKRNPKGDATGVAQQHELILLYAKDKQKFKDNVEFLRPKENAAAIIERAAKIVRDAGGVTKAAKNEFKAWIAKQDFSGGEKAYSLLDEDGNVYRPVSMAWPNKKTAPPDYFIPLLHPVTQKECPIPQRGWRNPSSTMTKLLENGLILFGEDESTQPTRKYLLRENMYENVPSLLYYGGSDDALLEELGVEFDNPKPLYVAKRLIQAICSKDDVVLDFFGGSGTAAHAVLDLNAHDGASRRFIIVQLDEQVKSDTVSVERNFDNIAHLARARLNNAGLKVLSESSNADWARDVGFRCLKIDTSNMSDVYYAPDAVKQQDLLSAVDNIKPDRSAEDLLFQVLGDWGVDLTLPIKREIVQGKTVFFVDDNALVACFDTGVTEELVKALASHEPLRTVFRDNGFVSDAVKINVEQIFRQLSPATDIKSI